MILKNFLGRFSGNRDRFNQIETESKIQKSLEQRGKNSNERELERFFEEERQAQIKKDLEMFRQKRKAEMRVNVFANQKNMFTGHKSILTEDNSSLGGKSMFMSKGNIF